MSVNFKKGELKKMRKWKTESGKEITLLTPFEKGKRYSNQLKTGVVAETGKILQDKNKAYMQGYLASQRDNYDLHLSKNDPAKLKEVRSKRAEYFKNKKMR